LAVEEKWRKVITGVWGVVSVKSNYRRAFPVVPDGPNNFKINWPPALIQKAP